MSEIQNNVEEAIANAAAKIAQADTVEEAQQWQSVISNLSSSLQQVERLRTESVEASETDPNE
jgi:hypothetical protein